MGRRGAGSQVAGSSAWSHELGGERPAGGRPGSSVGNGRLTFANILPWTARCLGRRGLPREEGAAGRPHGAPVALFPGTRSLSCEFNLTAPPPLRAPPSGRGPSRKRTHLFQLLPSQHPKQRCFKHPGTAQPPRKGPPRAQSITTNSWRCLRGWLVAGEKSSRASWTPWAPEFCPVPALHTDPPGCCVLARLAWRLFKYRRGSGSETCLCKHYTARVSSGA